MFHIFYWCLGSEGMGLMWWVLKGCGVRGGWESFGDEPNYSFAFIYYKMVSGWVGFVEEELKLYQFNLNLN